MKKAQKLTALALSCALAAACAMPAMAKDVTQDSTEQAVDTKVTYKQDSSYTVTIPQSITLNSAEAVVETVSASAVNLVPKATLRVSLAADTAVLSRIGDQDTKLTSVIRLADNDAPMPSGSDSYEVLSTTENNNKTVNLKFSALSAGEGQATIRAGEYTGTITFTVTVNQVTE